jgi:DNA-binding NtrC family response regulator
VARILVIEDDDGWRCAVRQTLSKHGHDVEEASNLADARASLQRSDFDVLLVDVRLGKESGIDLVRDARRGGYDGIVVAMTAHGTVESAVEAMREGADDYVQKPLGLEELSLQTDRWIQQRTMSRRLRLYERLEQSRDVASEMVGQSPGWRAALALADRVASLPLVGAGGHLPCILLLGETGVGKGVLARYIHARACDLAAAAENGRAGTGPAGRPPYVHVNCSALPSTLVESELFGHERGAFTDARDARPGLFEMADGGTICLDEVSEMSLEAQAKLLTVVEQRVFRRVGGTKERSVRVRMIAASNQDLEARTAAGAFRRDLLYRLNAFTIRIPPLRERPGDAELIADAILPRLARQFGRGPLSIGPAARAAIRAHPWPGNVRELINCVQRAAMLSESPVLEPTDLGLGLPGAAGSVAPAASTAAASRADPAAGTAAAGGEDLRFDFEHGTHTAEEVERALIVQALRFTGGNVSRAAKLIGMQRSSLRYRIERYRLEACTKEIARR